MTPEPKTISETVGTVMRLPNGQSVVVIRTVGSELVLARTEESALKEGP